VDRIRTEPVLAKTNFDGIYDQPDPRPYFRALGAYDYAVPHYGEQVFRRVLDALAVERPTVVDVCCSYGINAALLKHRVDLRSLYALYDPDAVGSLSTTDLVERDRAFFAGRRRPDAPYVVGLDTARSAVDYAVDVGLLDRGVVANLEEDDPPASLVALGRSVDLVTITGGIGYVTERTFSRLVGCLTRAPQRRPWVAALCLRTVSFEPIAACLAERGLMTERLEGVTFPQRRFTGDDEREYALSELDAMGIDATGREADGYYHVDVYLARPVDAVVERPIGEILGDLADVTHR
jgi:SAM-dependent methyltransferase